MPRPDGAQRAVGVTVFPENMRGTSEGQFAYDYAPESTMTNATVADVVAAPEGRKLRVRYKDSEKTIIIPRGTPIVSYRPGDRSLLVPGASVAASVSDV